MNSNGKKDAPSLKGKTIIFLGSSVTYGSAANGTSFVEFLKEQDGIIPVKEAVEGTTLADIGDASYVSRIKTLDPNIPADALVCQLSTNDASTNQELGQISPGTKPEDFDTRTVAGAMEYIISYAKETWNCPVIFYTGTRYDSAPYSAMVELLLKLQEKWHIGVIDLWNDPDMNAVSPSQYSLYMNDPIHPTRLGYQEWWTPKFEDYLKRYLQETAGSPAGDAGM